MNNKEANKLFKKYLKNKCTIQEVELLDRFLESYQSKGHKWYGWKYGDKKKFQLRNLQSIKAEIYKDKVRYRVFRFIKTPVFKYAAMFVGVVLMGASYFFMERLENSKRDFEELVTEITLELQDGSATEIVEGTTRDILLKNGTTQGVQKTNKIVYNESNLFASDADLVYNTLKVPYGKKFNITLSDGTQVYLNSGSNLKFPVKFIKGKSRKVFLTGEAIFEVVKNEEDVFIVDTKDLTTKVFGTEFNVSSYENETTSRIVLKEGSVGVHVKGTEFDSQSDIILEPSEMAKLEKGKERVAISTVDIYEHFSWVEGILFFKNESFDGVLRKLERHYNLEIINNYKELNKEFFTGKFNDKKDVEYILDIFSRNKTFNYELTNNKLIINP